MWHPRKDRQRGSLESDSRESLGQILMKSHKSEESMKHAMVAMHCRLVLSEFCGLFLTRTLRRSSQ
jgi:hypothetical protein